MEKCRNYEGLMEREWMVDGLRRWHPYRDGGFAGVAGRPSSPRPSRREERGKTIGGVTWASAREARFNSGFNIARLSALRKGATYQSFGWDFRGCQVSGCVRRGRRTLHARARAVPIFRGSQPCGMKLHQGGSRTFKALEILPRCGWSFGHSRAPFSQAASLGVPASAGPAFAPLRRGAGEHAKAWTPSGGRLLLEWPRGAGGEFFESHPSLRLSPLVPRGERELDASR